MAGRLVLAVLLVFLLGRHRRSLPDVIAKCWGVILLAVAWAAINGAWLEALAIDFAELAPRAPRRLLFYPLYNAGYLINASLAAMLPAALLALLLRGGSAGWVALAGVYAALVIALTGILRGSHAHWEVLLTTTAPLEILGLLGWIAFFVGYFLGNLPRVDGFLAAFVGVSAVFVMLTPMNEAIFRIVGRDAANAVWDPLLVMQITRYALQVGIVALLLRALRTGRAVGRAPDRNGGLGPEGAPG
jgi:hypothetical protein